MRILRFEAENFRNIKKAGFSPSSGNNILIGENGQGKTNFLEALCLFTGEKSFRRAKEPDLIRFGEKSARISVTFFSQGREQSASICYGPSEDGQNRRITLNGVNKKSPSALCGVLCMVVFSPEDLRVIKDGPEERRKLIDASVTQLIPSYGNLLRTYERTVFQRNSLLHELNGGGRYGRDMLDVWDERLVKLGSRIIKLRRHYAERISPYASERYGEISGGREELAIRYVSTGGEGEKEFLCRLRETRSRDISQGTTGTGPHRDDAEIIIGGKNSRFFGSQGQQRSAVLALKLGEASLLEEKYGEPPVLLLDDVLSELDTGRQEYLLKKLGGRQVFVTCCEQHASLKGSVRYVSGGNIGRKQPEGNRRTAVNVSETPEKKKKGERKCI